VKYDILICIDIEEKRNMKRLKLLTIGMSIFGATAICGGSLVAMTSCAEPKDLVKTDIGDDDFVLSQAETRVEQLSEMIFHSPNSVILPSESNGVNLSDVNTDVTLQMFGAFETLLNKVIDRNDAPNSQDIADILQSSLQILPVTSRAIFGLFANSLMIKYLVGESGSQDMVN
jgi:hypothetical protein